MILKFMAWGMYPPLSVLEALFNHALQCKINKTVQKGFRAFAPGFEDLFELGVNQGWYNVDKPLEK